SLHPISPLPLDADYRNLSPSLKPQQIKKSCFTCRSSEQERLDGLGGTLATVTKFMVNGSLRNCSFEGGIAGEPGSKAHGGYFSLPLFILSCWMLCSPTFIGGMIKDMIVQSLYNLKVHNIMEDWVVFCQASLECGFQGRTNKLVDGCYSFWQGAVCSLLKRLSLDIDEQSVQPYAREGSSFNDLSTALFSSSQMAKYKFRTIQFQKYFFSPSINCPSKQRLDISLRANTVYALYSLRHGSVRDELKSMVNTGLRMLYAEINTRARSLTWVSVKCAQQPGNTECRYYVMKFMQDIVRQKSITITNVVYLDSMSISVLFEVRKLEISNFWSSGFVSVLSYAGYVVDMQI
uniref:Prenyltransferase alpha-alpha toroid domain-containing protein n=1 Tax=Cucumis melo TaxID=3656 RepID=A0A9I9ELF7_CUCME